jgi:flagellum-specific peptidoglycan hydrolase FlgJ
VKNLHKILLFLLGTFSGTFLVATTLVQAYSNGIDVTPNLDQVSASSQSVEENPLSSYRDFEVDNSMFFAEKPTVEESYSQPKEFEEVDAKQAKKMKEEEKLMQQVREVRALYESYRAPMAGVSEHLVRTSKKYGVDYKLIVAISIVESGGGRKCFKKYNAFGWGSKSYNSFEHNLNVVIAGIANNYVAKGMNTPEKMAPVYNQANIEHWVDNVNLIMAKL